MKKEAVRINDIMKTHQKTQQWTQIYTNNSQPYKNTFNLVYFADPVSIKKNDICCVSHTCTIVLGVHHNKM